MAYDEHLADRVREFFPKAVEKKMFGGIGWMERGNLVVGVLGDELMVRLGPVEGPKALKELGVRPFDFTGKPMSGWVVVGEDAMTEEEDLESWVKRARAFTKTLPQK